MRCPHCASPRVAPPVCLTCGRSLALPAEQPTLAGLEVTRQPPVEGDAAPLAGLEPTVRASVAVAVLPAVELEPTARPPVGAVAPPALPELLPSGKRGGAAPTAAPAPALVVCRECSVPNPRDRALCISCGKRLG